MQAWMEKGSTAIESSSRGYGRSSLHFDETLSFLDKKKDSFGSASTISSGSSRGFRMNGKQQNVPILTMNKPQPLFDDYSNAIPEDYSSALYQQFTQPVTAHSRCYFPTYQQQNVVDGSEILYLLNTTNYTEQVYDDDFGLSSKKQHSYRHQLDSQHALSEKENMQHQWTAELLSSEDIVAYLSKTEYTDDIYGIPVLGELLKEAKTEISSNENNGYRKVAVERLTMIRDHLVAKANGDTDMAAKTALTMNTSDWSAFFS